MLLLLLLPLHPKLNVTIHVYELIHVSSCGADEGNGPGGTNLEEMLDTNEETLNLVC